MNKREKTLFMELCKFKENKFDATLLESATPCVLGYLFYNRMHGIAYDKLLSSGLINKVNREFRNTLKLAYEGNLEKNTSFKKCVSFVSNILKKSDCNVAMLKGALLCLHYPKGYRTSNDIDLLVKPSDVTTVGELLYKSGFRQGKIENGNFIPATRREIIESKMMRGETFPFIKFVNLPKMEYLEVDINFSLDYKNGESDLLESILNRTSEFSECGIKIPALCKEDFFIHLCSHLYKEATTLPWIEMHRDMTLYKYCDIYMLLSEMCENGIISIFNRAKELGLEKICAYAIIETSGLFDIDFKIALEEAKNVLKDENNFLLTVTSPKDKKQFVYNTVNVKDRFFLNNRVKNLKEVK